MHIKNFKNRGNHFVKWNDMPTILLYDKVFHLKKCSSPNNVPSKTAFNLMSTCSNMFQFLHRVHISSWCPWNSKPQSYKLQMARQMVHPQVHKFRFTIGQILHKQSVYLGWQNLKLYRFRSCCNNLRHGCIYQCLRSFFSIAFTAKCFRIIRSVRRNW